MSSLFQTKYDEDQTSTGSGASLFEKSVTGAAVSTGLGFFGTFGAKCANAVAGYCSGDKKKKKKSKKEEKED